MQFDCNSIQNSTAKQTESKISSVIQKAKSAAPVVVLLDNFDVSIIRYYWIGSVCTGCD